MVVIQNTIKTIPIDTQSLIDVLQQVIVDLGVGESELLIRLVDKHEVQRLNKNYRGKDKPTNVLSFPSDIPKEVEEFILGDVVICATVVKAEAKTQGKTFENHLIHMAVHGVLHLMGYDHIKDSEAEEMEASEAKILAKLGIANPYLDLS